MKTIILLTLSILLFTNCKKEESKTTESNTPPATSAAAPPEEVPSHEELKHERLYVSANVLKVRTAPDLKSETVTTLVKGDYPAILEYSENQSTVEGITSNWAKIKYDTIEGYVFAGFLTNTAPFLLSDKEKEQIEKQYNSELARREKAEQIAIADEKKDREALDNSIAKWRKQNKSKFKTEEELDKAEKVWYDEESSAIFSRYQSCSSVECGLKTPEIINSDKGCTPLKQKIINKIYSDLDKSVTSYNDLYIIQAFGDEYCILAVRDYGTQCSTTSVRW